MNILKNIVKLKHVYNNILNIFSKKYIKKIYFNYKNK